MLTSLCGRQAWNSMPGQKVEFIQLRSALSGSAGSAGSAAGAVPERQWGGANEGGADKGSADKGGVKGIWVV